MKTCASLCAQSLPPKLENTYKFPSSRAVFVRNLLWHGKIARVARAIKLPLRGGGLACRRNHGNTCKFPSSRVVFARKLLWHGKIVRVARTIKLNLRCCGFPCRRNIGSTCKFPHQRSNFRKKTTLARQNCSRGADNKAQPPMWRLSLPPQHRKHRQVSPPAE